MPEPLRLELHLLGRFTVGIEGRSEAGIRLSSRKSRALVAYLAMQPQFLQTRERLAGLLWGNSDDKQARQSLRQCLAFLRNELAAAGADVLVIERDTVSLAADRVAVDAREFLRLAESTDATDLERATELYAGPFLDKLDIDDEPFSDWVRAERARISTAAAQVFETCAVQADQAGRGAQAIKAAERLVALDPLREPAQRLLLRLLARHRGRDAALAQAEAVEALLHRELGVDPEPETQTLVDDIRAATGMRPLAAERVTTRRQPEGDAAAIPPGEITESRRRLLARSNALRWTIAVALVGGLGVFVLVQRQQPAPTAAQVTAATATQRTGAEQPWRSPVLPGVTADQPWMKAEGLYAVLVLPFAVETSDNKAEQILADRISDDLIGALSRVPAIRVISRQTSRLYRGRLIDVAAIGAELGVRYVVEGQLRLKDAHVTLNIALTDTASRLQLWSERFTRDAGEQPALQDDLIRSLARRLQINVVSGEDRRRLPKRGPADVTVKDLLAKGWGAMLRMSRADTTGGARPYFEEALKRDPDNASALTGLGAYYVQGVTMFLLGDSTTNLAHGEALLKQAIARNPHATLPYFYLGMAAKAGGQPHEALAAFVKVLKLNPSYAPAYAQVGHVLSRIGRLNEAIEHVRYAIRLSPKDHNVGIWRLFGGQIELELGHDDVALEWLLRAAELTPRIPFAQASLAAAYALRGDHRKAAERAEEVRRLAPSLTLERMKERLVGLSDKGGEPRRLLEGLHLAFAAHAPAARPRSR